MGSQKKIGPNRFSLFWRLMDKNKQTDRQAKFIYTYSDNQETEAKEENSKAFDVVTKQLALLVNY